MGTNFWKTRPAFCRRLATSWSTLRDQTVCLPSLVGAGLDRCYSEDLIRPRYSIRLSCTLGGRKVQSLNPLPTAWMPGKQLCSSRSGSRVMPEAAHTGDPPEHVPKELRHFAVIGRRPGPHQGTRSREGWRLQTQLSEILLSIQERWGHVYDMEGLNGDE